MADKTEPAAPAAPATHVDIEDYDRQIAAPAKPASAAEFKLEGDDIPEEYRGKTAADIVKEAKAFQNALRLSEDARTAMRTATESRQAAPPPPAAPVVEEPKLPTREEMKALFDEDPIAAMEKMNQIALANAERHLNVRLGQMTAGTASLAENWARQEFPDEFKLFGGDIQQLVDRIPDKTAFGTKKGWEDAVAYVRGQRGNFEKLMDFREKGPPRSGVEARMEQDGAAGFSGSNGTPRGHIPVAAPVNLDEVQKEIAKEFIASGVFKDEAEYVKWQKMGGAQ